jgi:hypothetical protein
MSYQNSVDSLKTAFEEYFHYLSSQEESIVVGADQVSKPTSMLLFIHDIEQLFKVVQQRTALRARNLFADSGEPLVDQVAMTEDERVFFTDFLREAAGSIQDILASTSKQIFKSFLFDEGVEIMDYTEDELYFPGEYVRYNHEIFKAKEETDEIPGEGDHWEKQAWWIDTKRKVVYFIQFNQKYNPTQLNIMFDEINLYLIYKVLSLWYDSIGMTPDAEKNFISADEKLKNIRRKTFHRTEVITRGSEWF